MIEVVNAVREAQAAASKKTADYLRENGDGFPCGFAWVWTNTKRNTKIGRALLAAGFQKHHSGGLSWWNPSGSFTQNMDAKEAGAREAARVLREKLGIEASAQSRMD